MISKVIAWLKGLPWWAWLLGVPVVIGALAILGRTCGSLFGIFKPEPGPVVSPGVSPAEGKELKEEATSIADAAVKAAEDYSAGEKARLEDKFGPGGGS